MEKKVKMITTVSQALAFRKKNPELTNEEILKKVSINVFSEKNNEAKIGMIAAASKALDINQRNPKLTEKEVINEVMKELSGILNIIDTQEK